jgi:hypothetical protein
MATVPALVGMVQKAASQLASATSAAEVLEARDTAKVAYDAAKTAARFSMTRRRNAVRLRVKVNLPSAKV